MDLRIFDAPQEIACAAGELIVGLIKEKRNAVLGLATGASPVETYKRLIQACERGEVSFADVRTYNLDEYCPIESSDKNSYYYFMHDKLFNHVDIKEENVHIPSGNPFDVEQYCAAYDASLEASGGIDLQLLGIGQNGHIGFNEPSDSFSDGTHIVELTESTIKANRIYFDSEELMPKKAITMGIGTIMRARSILLLAQGKAKAQAVYDMLKGPISPKCPASVLRMHSDLHVFIDRDAASML